VLILIKILTWIASPLGILALGAFFALALLLVRRLRWLSITIIFVAILQLIGFSSPIVADALLEPLENQARMLAEGGKRAEKILEQKNYAAIILLGGATTPASPPRRPDPDLGSAADRIWHAARLYQQGLAAKIIVSGGRSPGLESETAIQTEAQAMRLLLLNLGVPATAIILEEQSRTTRENAALTKKLIGNQPAALVTSAFHMPRSIKNFQKEGLVVDAFPTDFQVTPEVTPLWARVLPTAGALQKSEMALKEYIALLVNY
jgi:uncharacterized SAM-binding protein YcdF (DUF218 family)